MEEKETLLEETKVEARISYTRPIQLKSPQMYGEDVKAVQKKLNELNYDAGTVDGYYGPTGVAAVKDFQGRNGLSVDGSVGPATWNKLFASLQMPKYKRAIQLKSPQMNGTDVRLVQKRLNALNYAAGTVDGYYGSKGVAAVKDFQNVNGLSVDGSVGPATWNKLFSSSAKSKPSSSSNIGWYYTDPVETVTSDLFTFSVRTGGDYPTGYNYRLYSHGQKKSDGSKIWYKKNWKEGSTYQIYYRINKANEAYDKMASYLLTIGFKDLAKEIADHLVVWIAATLTPVPFDDIVVFLKGIGVAHEILGNITFIGYTAEYATHMANLKYHWNKI